MRFNSYGQSVENYFIPQGGNNTSILYTPKPDGSKSGFETRIYFIPKNGLNYIVNEVNLFNGEIASSIEKTISIANDKILLIKERSADVLSKGITTHNFQPPQTLLKIPTAKSIYASWEYKEVNNTLIKCTAVFTDVTIGYETRKAVKVLKNMFENGKMASWGSSIEFYVLDIGLYKILAGENQSEVFKILEKQIYDPEAPVNRY